MMAAADTFVFYDDVNFIERGWINRNYFLTRDGKKLFSVPLNKASCNKTINQIKIYSDCWKIAFERMLSSNYSKAPLYGETMSMLQVILNTKYNFINELSRDSITLIANKLDIQVKFVTTSAKYKNAKLERSERLWDICKQEKATEIIMPAGSAALYEPGHFGAQGIKLHRVQIPSLKYKQYKINTFEPHLSIIDLLMFNKQDKAKDFILDYNLTDNHQGTLIN